MTYLDARIAFFKNRSIKTAGLFLATLADASETGELYEDDFAAYVTEVADWLLKVSDETNSP